MLLLIGISSHGNRRGSCSIKLTILSQEFEVEMNAFMDICPLHLSTEDVHYLDQRVFHCILNLVFAIACKLDPAASPGMQESSSSVYLTRARSLFGLDLLDISDFHLVKASLLMSQYLQSTNMPCFDGVADI